MSALVETAPEEPLFKKRSSKKSIRKRALTPPPASDSDEEEYSSQDEDGRQIKRRRKTKNIVGASSIRTSDPSTSKNNETILDGPLHTSTLSTSLDDVNDATKHTDWFEGEGEKSLLGTTRRMPSKTDAPDGTYKGTSNYSTFITKNPNASSSISKLMGPQKPSANVRMVTTTDFAPDVCKDYKQTGFCGFGDSCKFLHAREDYKQGWQLDKEWESVSKGKTLNGTVVSKRGGETLSDEDEEDAKLETIPFKCVICKGDYKSPITTRCGHYFCEGCALKRYRKTTSCAICGEDTRGVFNGVKTLKRLLERKKERERKIREKRREEGEEVSESEEE